MRTWYCSPCYSSTHPVMWESPTLCCPFLLVDFAQMIVISLPFLFSPSLSSNCLLSTQPNNLKTNNKNKSSGATSNCRFVSAQWRKQQTERQPMKWEYTLADHKEHITQWQRTNNLILKWAKDLNRLKYVQRIHRKGQHVYRKVFNTCNDHRNF